MKVSEFIPGEADKSAQKIASQIVDAANNKANKDKSTYEFEVLAKKMAAKYAEQIQKAVQQEIKMRQMKHIDRGSVDTKA